jgi:hypothetical protein
MRSRTAGRPIKDTVREELDQDGELDDDLNSDSHSDIDNEDNIVSQIGYTSLSYFFSEQRLMFQYRRASSMKTTISSALRAATLSSARFRTAPSRLMARSTLHRVRSLHIYLCNRVLTCSSSCVLFLSHNARRTNTSTSLRNSTINRSPTARRKLSASVYSSSRDSQPPPQTSSRRQRKKKGKKVRKARQAAAAAVSLETIAEHMRAFVVDLGGGAPMLALPPMEKRMRKLVHDLAGAFNLKCECEGNDKARFTTLARTTMSGVRVGERRIARILGKPKPDGGGGKGKGKAVGKIRPRDGEVVGGVSVFTTKSLCC